MVITKGVNVHSSTLHAYCKCPTYHTKISLTYAIMHMSAGREGFITRIDHQKIRNSNHSRVRHACWTSLTLQANMIIF